MEFILRLPPKKVARRNAGSWDTQEKEQACVLWVGVAAFLKPREGGRITESKGHGVTEPLEPRRPTWKPPSHRVVAEHRPMEEAGFATTKHLRAKRALLEDHLVIFNVF